MKTENVETKNFIDYGVDYNINYIDYNLWKIEDFFLKFGLKENLFHDAVYTCLYYSNLFPRDYNTALFILSSCLYAIGDVRYTNFKNCFNEVSNNILKVIDIVFSKDPRIFRNKKPDIPTFLETIYKKLEI